MDSERLNMMFQTLTHLSFDWQYYFMAMKRKL